MTITSEDVKSLKLELQKDLDALERVERLLSSRNGQDHPGTKPIRRASVAEYNARLKNSDKLWTQRMDREKGKLKMLVITALNNDHGLGRRPFEILKDVQAGGYLFTSDKNGAASINTVLTRLLKGGAVERRNSKYFWKKEQATQGQPVHTN